MSEGWRERKRERERETGCSSKLKDSERGGELRSTIVLSTS